MSGAFKSQREKVMRKIGGVHGPIINLNGAETIVLYEAIPVWSGLSKQIFGEIV